MANTDYVTGFKPVGTLSAGMGGIGYVQRCLHVGSTELAVGDIVKLEANAQSLGVPTVIALTTGATDVPYGCCVGIELWDGSDSAVTQTLDTPRYLAASARAYALIAIAPDLIMEVQSSVAVEDGDMGAKTLLVGATPDTTRQSSGQEVGTAAADSTYVFHVLELFSVEDNDLGASGNVLVTFNIHELGRGCYDVNETDIAGSGLGVHA